MRVWCLAAHRRFWRVEERFVDAFGMIEYWVCAVCHRRWSVSLPPIDLQTIKPRGQAPVQKGGPEAGRGPAEVLAEKARAHNGH